MSALPFPCTGLRGRPAIRKYLRSEMPHRISSLTVDCSSIHWMVPTAAGGVLATSLMMTFAAYINYVVDSYTEFATAAMAANTCARSIGSALSPLYTNYMFKSLGVTGGGTLVAALATALAIVPFILYKHGGTIRRKSKYASGSCALEAKQRKQSESESESEPSTPTSTLTSTTITVNELKSAEEGKGKWGISLVRLEKGDRL